MVNGLRAMDTIVSEPVAAALGTVPRHVFAPDEPLARVYDAHTAIVVKRGEAGDATSLMSAPHIQAVQLEQAAIEPGMRVMEIGSGGYNAALIQELVGDTGAVVTVDIDPAVTTRARACLDDAGYANVDVVLADAEHGVPDSAPYDRILVTAGAWDIPPAWIRQLTGDGRLVVPVRMRGLTRSVAFDRQGPVLVGDSYRLAAFVPMQGDGAYVESVVEVIDGVGLRFDGQTRQFDTAALADALQATPTRLWSGAVFDLPDELQLFLMTSDPDMVMLHATQARIDSGLLGASTRLGVPALVRGGSFAYRVKRDNDAVDGGYESGVVAHGPQAKELADRYARLLREWARRYRRRDAASIRYVPKDVDSSPSDAIAVKRWGAVTVSWS